MAAGADPLIIIRGRPVSSGDGAALFALRRLEDQQHVPEQRFAVAGSHARGLDSHPGRDLQAAQRLRLRAGSTSIGAESAPLAAGQLYRIGEHQKAGSGGDAVLEAFLAAPDDRPTCFICYTVKGKNLPFAPEVSGAALLTYHWPMAGGNGDRSGVCHQASNSDGSNCNDRTGSARLITSSAATKAQHSGATRPSSRCSAFA